MTMERRTDTRCRSALGLASALLCACAAVPERSEHRQPTSDLALRGRQTNLVVGLRMFEDSAWDQLDDQALFALDYAEPIALGATRLEGGLHYSWDEANGTLAGGGGVGLHSQTFEASAGLNSAVRIGRLRPYIGFGAALLFVDVKGEEAGIVFRDSDVTGGGYLKGGLLLQVSPTTHFGLEYRHLEGGQVSFGSDEASTNYDQFALVFGTSF